MHGCECSFVILDIWLKGMSSEKFDVLSVAFNASEALASSSNIVLPFPNAKTYNNLAEFDQRVLEGRPPRIKLEKKTAEDKPLADPLTNKSTEESPVPTTSKRQKANVLIRMNTAFNKGPLNLLNKCVQQRIRVRVSIRNYGDIRGTCTGFIVAFDKHWNLAMQDVDEVYVKRQALKTPVLRILQRENYSAVTTTETSETTATQSYQNDEESPRNFSSSIAVLDATVSDIKITEERTSSHELPPIETIDSYRVEASEKSDVELGENLVIPARDTVTLPLLSCRRRKKKSVICQRHVNQLFIRGDNVVFVRLLT